MKKPFRWFAAALAIAIVSSIAPGAFAAGDPIEIPVMLSLTGPGSFLGKNENAGLAMVEKLTNQSGGINGRPIKFMVQDDQSNPQVALQLASGMMTRKTPVIMGSSLVAACNAVAPLLKNGPVLYCLSAGYQPESGSYQYAYGVSTRELIVLNLRYYRERGLTKIALLTSTDASGQDGERAIDAGLALPENKAAFNVVAREHYAVNDLNVTAQITRVKQSGAQAMIAWGTGTPIGTVFHSVADVGLDIPIAVSASNLIYAEMTQYASILPKEMLSAGLPCVALGSLPAGKVRAAVQQYVDAFRAEGIRADIAQAISWDPGWLVVNAYRKLGANMTAAQLRDYLNNVHDWAGANGMYDFHQVPQRGALVASSLMVRWDPAKETWVAASKLGGGIR